MISRDYQVKYYEPALSNEHGTGDIWTDLPTFGLFPNDRLPGIVITPACDLANCKVSTITYLPILPIKNYFGTFSAIPDLIKRLDKCLRGLGQPEISKDLIGSFSAPSSEVLDALTEKIKNLPADKAVQKSQALSVLSILSRISSGQNFSPSYADLESIFSTEFEGRIREMVCNAGRPDTFFLPDDMQRKEWSAVPEHSVAMFRFPISIPVAVLDLAQALDLNDEQWAEGLLSLKKYAPLVGGFVTRPAKKVSLRAPFISDLLSRYVSIHVKAGTPDFSPELLDTFFSDIRKP